MIAKRYERLAQSPDFVVRRVAVAQLARLQRQSAAASEAAHGADGDALVSLYIRRVGPLTPKGVGKLVGSCPWHSSRSGACLIVWPAEGRWWCSSCRRGGDAIRLLALLEGISVHDARRRLGLPTSPTPARRRPTLSVEVSHAS